MCRRWRIKSARSEPGIYLEEFSVRSEIKVFVDGGGTVHVTGGLQTEVLPILGTSPGVVAGAATRPA
jgi:hypothetical protein